MTILYYLNPQPLAGHRFDCFPSFILDVVHLSLGYNSTGLCGRFEVAEHETNWICRLIYSLVPVIDFSRNHIIVGIHELAREARSERVRLAAWSKLADI